MSIEYDTTKVKQYTVDHTISEIGRRRSLVTCPFCYESFYAFHWSLAGSGKKCPDCGAENYVPMPETPIEISPDDLPVFIPYEGKKVEFKFKYLSIKDFVDVSEATLLALREVDHYR